MADRGSSNKARPQSSQTRGKQSAPRRPSQGQRTSAKASASRATDRKVLGASHAPKTSSARSARSSQYVPRKATNVTSGTKRARSRSAGQPPASSPAAASSQAASATLASMKDRLLENRVATAIVGIVLIVVLAILFDTAINWGRAYGNVSINGVSVAGMNAEEMRKTLDDEFGSKLAASQVTVYASEEARQLAGDANAQQSDVETAEEVSLEESQQRITSWTADGSTLAASLPYDQVIGEALEAGRKGGPFGRIALAIGGENVPLDVSFDAGALENFAAEIDKTVGNARADATVTIQDGKATPVDGHDGTMVDRAWLAERLSNVMLGKNGETYVIAEAVGASSRTTMEQAQRLSDGINKAIGAGVAFKYRTNEWTADAYELGSWTRVDVVEAGDGFDLKASLDADKATSSLVKNVSLQTQSASSDAEAVTVNFEKGDDGSIVVKTSGTGEVPEVVPAIESANEALYGETGIAWSASSNPQAVSIDIGESNAPETLDFEQAVDMGIITVIGEYMTEFSNEEGTENRNHNIKLVSDILNDTICESGGGKWSFNEHTGDTNLDPPFASAGSIVNGEYVDSIGGGICQVATTVFNAVYEAGLDVVQRRNHSLYIASYPTGRDVGVSYPDLDFVWANNLKSDVLVKLSHTDTSVTCQLYSVYTGYQVETTEGEWQEGAKYGTEYVEDDALAKGDYYLKTTGEDGSRITVTRKVTDKSGTVVSETEFESNYDAKNEVYAIGAGTDTSGLARDTSSSTASYGGGGTEESDASDDETLDEEGASAETYDDTGEVEEV